MIRRSSRVEVKQIDDADRLRRAGVVWLCLGALFVVRLFYIQIVQHEKYSLQASGTRDLTETIKPKRGEIFSRDARSGQQTLYPIALNRDQIMLVSDNRKIEDPRFVATVIGTVTSSTPEQIFELERKLAQSQRAYQVLIRDLNPLAEDALRNSIKEQRIGGLYFDRTPARFYPEKELFGHITGFVGKDEQGEPIGRYGVEGGLDERLHGVNGYVKTEKDPFGNWIPVADREFTAAHDGDDLILSVDRTIQLKLCQALQAGIEKHNAKSALGVIMNPKTGEVLALCSVPQFDPNAYQSVSDARIYNNDAVFTPYEPGSVFKIVTMASALDAGVITPQTTFTDEGFVRLDGHTIRNAAEKVWGVQDMTGVIKESINTGTIFAAQKLGRESFKTYVERFGFGGKTGIEIKTEVDGNIKSLQKKGEVFLATASFGQGITTTPIQLLDAFATVANDGIRVEPTMIHAWRSKDGTVEFPKPREVGRIISKVSADQVTTMMRAVVEEGHGKSARVPGYTIVGKTGTAQIVGAGGTYSDTAYNHTFIGFGPAADPAFVMLIKYEAPEERFAETTAVPTFGEVAKFLLEYLGVQPDKPKTP